MVNNEVKRHEFPFPPAFNQEMISAQSQLSTIYPPDVLDGRTNTLGLEHLIDVFTKSAGSALAQNNIMALKRVEIPIDIPASGLFFENFFTSIVEDTSTKFSVLTESNANGIVRYNLVLSWIQAAPTGNLDLLVVTLKDPPGSFPTLPSTVTPPFQAEVVKRQVGGNEFVYDYFIVCPPP